MSKLETYREIFKECFQFDGEVENLEYQKIDEWDSVAHMQLMAMIEEEFNIEMDIDDVIDFSGFKVGIDILKKYDLIIE